MENVTRKNSPLIPAHLPLILRSPPLHVCVCVFVGVFPNRSEMRDITSHLNVSSSLLCLHVSQLKMSSSEVLDDR